MIRDKEAKEDLLTYINDHPEQRLWQAIRNWAMVGFVWIGDDPDGKDMKDTFYIESKIEE